MNTQITPETFARIMLIILDMPGNGLRVVCEGPVVLVGPEGGALDAEFDAREGANDLTDAEIIEAIEFTLNIKGPCDLGGVGYCEKQGAPVRRLDAQGEHRETRHLCPEHIELVVLGN